MTMAPIRIRPATIADLPAITDMYNQGVEDRTATCDLQGFKAEDRRDWFHAHRHPYGIWLATDRDVPEPVLGWVALSRYEHKPCFAKTATFSTYVHRNARGRGVGSALRSFLIAEARRRGLHTIVNRVFAPNEASIALAKKFGMVEVGRMKELVFRDGDYVDCVFFQLMLTTIGPSSRWPPDGRKALTAGP
jgi:L-amino acid N-acyltransferase YncA